MMMKMTLNLRFTSKFAVIAYAIYSLQWQMVHLNPVLSIDCDCSSASFEMEPNTAACCVNDPPDFNVSTPINFINVPNISSLEQFTLHTKQNLTDIPAQFLDTFTNLKYIELSIGIQQLPLRRLPTKLKQLNLSNNRITAIDIDAFTNIGGNLEENLFLEQISLQYNRIESIAVGAFRGLNKLQVLILYHNKLTILRANTFTGAPNIQSLDLACNDIVTIEDGALNLPMLKEILISENKLKSLSDTVFDGVPNLQNVDLQKNQLERIGHAFTNLKSLHQLQLSENRRLGDLNVLYFSKFPELISLSLDATGIQSLGVGASDAASTAPSPLNTLSLSQNQLSQHDFLRILSIFSKLEKLFVDANKFTRFDDADVRNIKRFFPQIELIVTKNNAWDRKWVENILIPVFQTNNIFCSNIKYLNTYIEGFTNSIDGQIIEGTECI